MRAPTLRLICAAMESLRVSPLKRAFGCCQSRIVAALFRLVHKFVKSALRRTARGSNEKIGIPHHSSRWHAKRPQRRRSANLRQDSWTFSIGSAWEATEIASVDHSPLTRERSSPGRSGQHSRSIVPVRLARTGVTLRALSNGKDWRFVADVEPDMLVCTSPLDRSVSQSWSLPTNRRFG